MLLTPTSSECVKSSPCKKAEVQNVARKSFGRLALTLVPGKPGEAKVELPRLLLYSTIVLDKVCDNARLGVTDTCLERKAYYTRTYVHHKP
jgi:hypothetical protein